MAGKADIVDAIAAGADLTKKQAADAFDSALFGTGGGGSNPPGPIVGSYRRDVRDGAMQTISGVRVWRTSMPGCAASTLSSFR